jgi:antibiotic biosynthesis monooxygenase (ABM) superfamily enzyme
MMSETTISADNPVVTLINVFTVEPSRQQQLVELWQRATDEVLRHLPGFVSANVHRSFDGTKVVNYAQWQTREAFQAMLANPDARPWLEQLAEVGAPAPVVCEVVSPTTRPVDPSANRRSRSRRGYGR